MSSIEDRLHRFRCRAFGLFVHWGLYSQLGQGEWVWNYHYKHRREEYMRLFDSFTAADFDAERLVDVAFAAGCRYVCLTTRHHEGFSLYDTRGLNRYDAPHSPAGRDLIAEFSQACEARGVGKFFYHTTLDWWHPEFDGDWDAYQQYLRDSVEILCTHYGQVDGLWFDGNWARRDRDWQEDALYGLIRRRQPDCIIVNNSSHGHHGEAGHREVDVVTYEQGLPAARQFSDRPRSGEMCETINSHWGIGAEDLSHKSPTDLITRLAACRRHGANLLLNLGPSATGAVPDYEAAALALVGRWTRVCPEALYEAEPTALRCRGQDFVLRQGQRYYYFCHNVAIHGNRHLLRGEAGDGLQTVAGALPPVSRIFCADAPETDLAFTQADEQLCMRVPPYPYGRQQVIRILVIETAG